MNRNDKSVARLNELRQELAEWISMYMFDTLKHKVRVDYELALRVRRRWEFSLKKSSLKLKGIVQVVICR